MPTSDARNTLAAQLKEFSEAKLRSFVHAYARPWNASVDQINPLYHDEPDLFDANVVGEISTCRTQGTDLRNHIVEIVRKNQEDRDYDNLAHALSEFAKWTDRLRTATSALDENIMRLKSINIPHPADADSDETTAQPITPQPAPSNDEVAADEASAKPEVASEQRAVSGLGNWLNQLRDTKSPSADPVWREEHKEKQARKKHAHA